MSDGDAGLAFIAFYKGDQIPDALLTYLVNAAYRGGITEAGRNLWLVPIKAYEIAQQEQQAKADKKARQSYKRGLSCNPGPASPSIRKRDCIPLTSFLPKSEVEQKRRIQQFAESGPLFPMPPEPKTVTPIDGYGLVVNRNGTCPCGRSLSFKRKGAKYCSQACKQKTYRKRA